MTTPPNQISRRAAVAGDLTSNGGVPAAPESAVRSGAKVFAAVLVGTAASYLFNLAAARWLGAEGFGVLVALTYVVTLITLPLSALQMTFARELSTALVGNGVSVTDVRRSFVRSGLWASLGTIVGFAILMIPLARILNIDSVGAVALAGLSLAPAPLFLIFLGGLQGAQDFGRVALGSAVPAVARTILLVPFLLLGLALNGALLASAVSSLLGLVVVYWWQRGDLSFARPVRAARSSQRHLRAQVPVALTLLALTSLTSADVLVVKASLSERLAGEYSAVSLLGKLVFFVPTVIATVLFPRVAARLARKHESSDILGRAMIVTFIACAIFFGVLALDSAGILRAAFGYDYVAAAPYLVPFGIGMTLFSLVAVAANYHLSRDDGRFVAVLVGGAALHVIALAVFHQSIERVLWVNAIAGFVLIAAHEVRMGSSGTALRAGSQQLWQAARDPSNRARLGRRLLPEGRFTSRRLAEGLWITTASTTLAVFLTWPLAAHPGSRIFGGGGDSTGAIYWFWRSVEKGYDLFGVSPQTDTGAPFGWVEGNGVNVAWALVSYPTHLAARVFGEIGAYNLMTFAGLILPAITMYAFTRRLGAGVHAATWGALVFTIFPWHIEKSQGHGALATIYLFPIFLWVALLWYERPSVRRALALGLVNLGLWLTMAYFGLVAGVATLVLIAITAVRHGRLGSWRRAWGYASLAVMCIGSAAFIIKAITRLGAAPGSTALPVRSSSELQVYGARLHEFVVPSYRSTFFGDDVGPWLASRLHGSNFSEASLTIGFVTLALAIGYVLWTVGRRQTSTQLRFAITVLPAFALTAFAFSLPNPIVIGDVSFTSPSRLLNELVPQFRVPTRFMPLLMAALIAMGTLFLDVVIRRAMSAVKQSQVPKRSLVAAASAFALTLVVCATSFVELATTPPALVSEVGTTPPIYEDIRQVPNGILAEYPLVSAAYAQNSDYLFWQRVHRRPLLTGAAERTFADAVRDTAVNPADPGTPGVLSMLGVTAVIMRPTIPPGGSDFVRPDPGPFGFSEVRRLPDGTGLWRVTAPPSEALATFSRGFLPAEIPAKRMAARWLTGDGEMTFYAREPGAFQADFSVSSYGDPRTISFGAGPTARRLTVGSRRLTVTVALPKGFSRLRVATTPGPEALPDGRIASIYMTNWRLRRVAGTAEPSPIKPTPIPPPTDVVMTSGSPGRP